MAVQTRFITKDGAVLEQLPETKMAEFRQKILDLFTPILYESVVKDLTRERREIDAQVMHL